jgi:phosphomannomutase
MPKEIKFGTDGWRGVIADDYTFENVRRAGGAIAAYVLKNEDPKKGIVVGYDTRFGSRNFALAISEVLTDAGIPVFFSNDYTPTPAISFCAKHWDTAGGIAITSSHNPYMWNGVKFKEKFGGSARPGVIKQIEAEIAAGSMPKGQKAKIEERDVKAPHREAIQKFADLDLICKAGFKILVDYMYGSGRGVVGPMLREHGVNVVEIRGEVNPLFPGINPEPIEPHVKAAQETVVREGCHAGFITDGDADRIGAVAEDGSFVDAHKCYAVILYWLLKYKKWPGAVTRAFNTTRMLDRIAKKYDRELIEHGIGFKYVCDVVFSGKEVLIGGEESGGIGIPRYLPERDGMLNSLLLANAMADEKKSLGQIVKGLQEEFGWHHYGRRDLTIADEIKFGAIRRADSGQVKQLGKFNVIRKENLDGVKFYLDAPNNNGRDAEAWVLIRASGTEPLMRIYSEAASPEIVQEILNSAVEFVHEKGTSA